MTSLVPLALLTAVSVSLSAPPAQNGAALFEQQCAPCHTIGADGGAAPDLKGVTARRDRAWVARFILDPEAVVKSGDAYAAELVRKADGMIMPAPDGLDRDAIDAIVAYIDARSAGAPAQAAGTPFAASPEDIARGRALYAGAARLANRGPSCLSCHHIDSSTGMRGGTLGPNLAHVSDRLNGPAGVSRWLSAPPTPVMRTVYRASPLTPDEVRALAAFFDDRARLARAAPDRGGSRAVLGAGVGGAIAGFVLIGGAWRHRFRAVRRPLIAGAAIEPPASSGAVTRQGFRSGGPR